MSDRDDEERDEAQAMQTSRLQSVIDKSKTYAIASNSLTPPINNLEDQSVQIAIIRSLQFSTDKARDVFYELTCTQLVKGKLEIVDTEPMMNLLGGKRLLGDLKTFSEVDFSNLKEDDIGSYEFHFFKEIWPYYTANRIRYGIRQMDMGHVKIKLQSFILSCFNKGKNAKLLNVAGRTFSEEWGTKILGGDAQAHKKEGFLDKYNPFKKMG